MDSALGLIGLALRAGRLAVGETAVEELCAKKKCRLLLVSSDAALNTLRKAERLAEMCRSPLLTLPCIKSDFGTALGRQQCAIAALSDPGFANAIMDRVQKDSSFSS